MTDTTRGRSPVRTMVQGTLGLGLAAALLVWGLPHFGHTTWGAVWGILRQVPPATVAVLVVGVVAGLYCYTLTLTASMPGLRHWQALIVNVAGSAVGNLLPGGGAVGLAATYTICRSWGFSRRDISTSAIVTGVWNVLSRIALPLVAIAGLLAGDSSGVPQALQDAALAATVTGALILVTFIAVLVSERAAVVVGRSVDRVLGRAWPSRSMTVRALVVDLRARINDVVRHGWWRLTLGLCGYFGIYYLLFLVCMATTEVHLHYGQLFAAYAIGRLATAVGVTPGGLGVTESVTVAALVAWGAGHPESVAGAVLFSVFTHVMEVPLGALGWLAWSLSPKPGDAAHASEASGPSGASGPSEPQPL